MSNLRRLDPKTLEFVLVDIRVWNEIMMEKIDVGYCWKLSNGKKVFCCGVVEGAGLFEVPAFVDLDFST